MGGRSATATRNSNLQSQMTEGEKYIRDNGISEVSYTKATQGVELSF